MRKTQEEAELIIAQQPCTKLKQTMVIVYETYLSTYLSTYLLHLYLAKHMSESYRNRFIKAMLRKNKNIKKLEPIPLATQVLGCPS